VPILASIFDPIRLGSSLASERSNTWKSKTSAALLERQRLSFLLTQTYFTYLTPAWPVFIQGRQKVQIWPSFGLCGDPVPK